MKETGVVHAVREDGILVGLKRHAACLGCRACSIGSSGEMIIKAACSDRLMTETSCGIKVGDQVSIEIDSTSVVKAIALVYLLPAIAFLAGIFAGLRIASLLSIYKHQEIFSMLTGLVFLGASLFFARQYGARRSGAYQARITGIVNSG